MLNAGHNDFDERNTFIGPKTLFFCLTSNFTPKIKTGSCSQVYGVNDLVMKLKLRKDKTNPEKFNQLFLGDGRITRGEGGGKGKEERKKRRWETTQK